MLMNKTIKKTLFFKKCFLLKKIKCKQLVMNNHNHYNITFQFIFFLTLSKSINYYQNLGVKNQKKFITNNTNNILQKHTQPNNQISYTLLKLSVLKHSVGFYNYFFCKFLTKYKKKRFRYKILKKKKKFLKIFKLHNYRFKFIINPNRVNYFYIVNKVGIKKKVTQCILQKMYTVKMLNSNKLFTKVKVKKRLKNNLIYNFLYKILVNFFYTIFKKKFFLVFKKANFLLRRFKKNKFIKFLKRKLFKSLRFSKNKFFLNELVRIL